MTSTPSLNPRILGQAENAHRALLTRILEKSGTSYTHWVVLNLVATAESAVSPQELRNRVASALKIEDAEVAETVETLVRTDVLSSDAARLALTESGLDLYGHIRAEVDQTVTSLYDGVPREDLAAAGRVLVLLTERANSKLGTIS